MTDPRTRHAFTLWTQAQPAVSAFVHVLTGDRALRDEVLQEASFDTKSRYFEVHGRLRLEEKTRSREPNFATDLFFESMAKNRGKYAMSDPNPYVDPPNPGTTPNYNVVDNAGNL